MKKIFEPANASGLRGRMRMGKLAVALSSLLSLLPVFRGEAADPAWWTSQGAINNSSPSVDNAVATQGQAMHMAKKAKAEFDAKYSALGGAGADINALFTTYNPQYSSNNDKALKVGQLKHVASKFWLRLRALGAPGVPLAPYWPYVRNGVNVWTKTTSDDNDQAMATLGQVKMAFSFDVPAPTAKTGGGVPAWWWGTPVNYPGQPDVGTGILAGDQSFPTGSYLLPSELNGESLFAAGTKISFWRHLTGYYVSSGFLAGDQDIPYGKNSAYDSNDDESKQMLKARLKSGTEALFEPWGTFNRGYLKQGTLANNPVSPYYWPMVYNFAGATVPLKGGSVARFHKYTASNGNIWEHGFVKSGVLAIGCNLSYGGGTAPFRENTTVEFEFDTVPSLNPNGIVRRGVLNQNHDIYYGSGRKVNLAAFTEVVFDGNYVISGVTSSAVTLQKSSGTQAVLAGSRVHFAGGYLTSFTNPPNPPVPNPNPKIDGDPSQFSPEVEATTLVVVGGQEVSQPETEPGPKEVTLPPGSGSYLVVLAIKSEEYPEWTSNSSVYNDTVTAQWTVSGGSTQSSTYNVNSLHSEFNASPARKFLGYSPAALRILGTVSADPSAPKKVSLNLTITNVADGNLPTTGILSLVPMDMDIIHPGTGELSEVDQHDQAKGGLVAVHRGSTVVPEDPITKLVIRAAPGVTGLKWRLRFTGGTKFDIFKDSALTQYVFSDSTEFNTSEDTTLYFKGREKSTAVGGQSVSLILVNGSQTFSVDTVYFTVVEAQIYAQVRFWIREGWLDVPPHPLDNFWNNKIAGGDGRDASLEHFANYRVAQDVVLVPFKELDVQGNGGRPGSAGNFSGVSTLYHESSVPDYTLPYSASNQLFPGAVPLASERPDTSRMRIATFRNDNRSARVAFQGAANDPLVTGSLDIDWFITLYINAVNPLLVQYSIDGLHDQYPAVEVNMEPGIRGNLGSGGTTYTTNPPQPYNYLHALPGNVFLLGSPNFVNISPPKTGEVK